MTDLPFDGTALRLAAALASVAPGRLPELLRETQRHLASRRASFDREFERIVADDERVVYLVPRGHWETAGERLGFDRREADAVRRAHEAQVLRLGTRTERREEFESALEIREAVVIGRTDTPEAD